ncbi:MAG TPA: DUF1015 family protein [Thermotogota bacterium]|nr:DUF1015 domain-containing protein [Thermotogota bacterium]OQC31974.1 MAG: hypothetical protein BWX67_00743 [Thermotogota bacterium ADurb.Bin062]HNW47019.1 DUF1015 family protein [Thermotogota bacterium]HNY81401.1 DUF1015 family protein [Thermotogota bacterium]HOD91282.1 DUF1015 family protein [Thermotogota bacterium]
MAVIKPFRAVRPPKHLVGKIASKPYDVIDSEEARAEVVGNPYSFLHVVKSEVDCDPSVSLYDPQIYAKARANLESFIEKGYLVPDREPALFVYRHTWKGPKCPFPEGQTQTGVLGAFSCEEYQKGSIKKHEWTRRDKEDDRLNHILTTKAQTGLVFLAYKHQALLDTLVQETLRSEPEYRFSDELDVVHELFVVNDPKRIAAFQRAFEQLPELYIADGHHRSASSSRAQQSRKAANPRHTGEEEYNFFMAVAFPDNQLKILDYNRVVKDLNGRSEEDFLKAIQTNFSVQKAPNRPYRPLKKGEFGMYLGNQWYVLGAKPGSFPAEDPVKRLDVSILQENLLNPLLGIQDPRTDKRIHFVGGIRGLKELETLVDSGNWKVAFSMFPTSLEDLFAVADQGKTMPPKSTWFEPKLKSGLVVHFLDS